VAAIVAAMLLVSAAEPPAERVVSGDGIITARVAGLSVRMRIDPAAPAMPLIDRAIARRAGLKLTGSWGVGIGYSVGDTGVMTRTQVVPVDLGNRPAKRRVGWAGRSFARDVEASAGPAAFPEPIVRFQLHDARPDETTTTFRATHDSALFGLFGNFGSTFATIIVGGQPMRLRLDPHHSRSLATAGAAVRLAAAQDGVVTGAPVQTEIFFGIERPVRTLTLRRPLAVGALRIATLGVRTSDAGNAASIREGDVPPAAPDPDEIVVTAKGKARDVRRDTLSLGADQLRRCSSIVFDKIAETVALTCTG